MKAYKGFDKDLKCRGFQYEVGKEYEEPVADCPNKGFHACENPLDVLAYYNPANSRFCEVELSGEIDRDGNDSQIASTKIKIGKEIGLSELINAGVKFALDKAGKIESKTGEYSTSTNKDKHSASTNTVDRSVSTNTGDFSVSTNTGLRSVSTNTGDYSVSTNIGNYSASIVTGQGSVAIATGCKSKAKASIGSAIVICERGDWNGREYPLIGIKAAIVDGEKLKADTYYTLKNGEFVEVNG